MEHLCASDSCRPEDYVELTSRESTICQAVCSSPQPVSFGQLKESTSLHQEVLSRALRRLAIHGLIKKVDGKYEGTCCT